MADRVSRRAGDSDDFLLGVNYWPRRKAMYWWSDFDRGEVAEEFDLIADIGFEVVRIFLLWEDWQPSPDLVSADAMRDLGTVCDLAGERGLRLDVTFFTGHMSGPNWVPGWMLDRATPLPSPDVRQVVSGGTPQTGSYRNMFTDPEIETAARLLVRTVVGEYRHHEAIWMWNLGNEPDLFARPTSSAAGWVASMRAVIGELDGTHPVTCGLHSASLLADNGFRVDQVFAECDVAVMHGYPMYIPWARHPLDPDFLPFLCALTTALTGKPTLAEEWGGCTAPRGGPSTTWTWNSYGRERSQFMAGEEELAEYVARVLPGLVDVGASGALLWCFADYAEVLWDRPPCEEGGAKHERHFGLVRPDGSLKPHAASVKSFAATNPRRRPPRCRVPALDPDWYYRDPNGNARRLFELFTG